LSESGNIIERMLERMHDNHDLTNFEYMQLASLLKIIELLKEIKEQK